MMNLLQTKKKFLFEFLILLTQEPGIAKRYKKEKKKLILIF